LTLKIKYLPRSFHGRLNPQRFGVPKNIVCYNISIHLLALNIFNQLLIISIILNIIHNIFNLRDTYNISYIKENRCPKQPFKY